MFPARSHSVWRTYAVGVLVLVTRTPWDLHYLVRHKRTVRLKTVAPAMGTVAAANTYGAACGAA